MSKLDDLKIANVNERLFTAKRLKIILEGLTAMHESKHTEGRKRRASLEAELANTNDKLGRLYRVRNCAWSRFCTQLARPKRFELLTPRFVVWCSIQLSYGRGVS
jgi:hypothetical protein